MSSPYVIIKGNLPPFARLRLIWVSLASVRLLYLAGLLALMLEALFTLAAPVLIKICIDSLFASLPPRVPPLFDGLARALLGNDYNTGTWHLRSCLRDYLWMMGAAL